MLKCKGTEARLCSEIWPESLMVTMIKPKKVNLRFFSSLQSLQASGGTAPVQATATSFQILSRC